MEISKRNDNSRLRFISEEKFSLPVVNLLLQRVRNISRQEGFNCTLLAVCPNSENVIKAALRTAKRAHSPIMFAATLNQVDLDGGYTGWTQHDLIRKIKEQSYIIGYENTVITGVDHGGPWLKDIHLMEEWNLNETMDWIKKSFEAALLAGYDILHVDPTVDIFSKSISMNTVVMRTVELISHVENFRKMNNLKPVAYEVGTEEVHGGLSDIENFKSFLELLKNELKKVNLDHIWPAFIVGQVGTDLHTTTFNEKVAKSLVEIAGSYNSFIKGHYTDFVSNPENYPGSGIMAANVGPEFTVFEYDALLELCAVEDRIYRKNKVGCKSNFKEILEKAVLDSNRWKKWLKNNEKNFYSLDRRRKEWIIKTCSRYVWALPQVKCAQINLYKNLELNGIDAESWVIMKIEESMDKYFRAFNLINLNEKLDRRG